MTDDQHNLNQLYQRLNALIIEHEQFGQEIKQLRKDIQGLTASIETKGAGEVEKDSVSLSDAVEGPAEGPMPWEEPFRDKNYQEQERTVRSPRPAIHKPIISPEFKADFEKFVGENLINKIGIAITVLGVGIGAKYAIDNQLISPLTRIILGYLMGVGLMGFAIKLKEKYENFSAVLLSGAMAIMYFITFAAYSFYGLIPQALTFGLMVLFTAFTVVAAIHYNRQVIAHIGLVGAYAVPFLLSEGEGKVGILFSYMAIINAGILVIAFKRYWKPLYYSAFSLTWLIYLFWYEDRFIVEEHFGLAFSFLFVFFAIFYGTFLSYKLFRGEKFEIGNVLLLLGNSFVFYGIGYGILEDHAVGEQLLGLFTLLNAVVHFSVSVLIYKKRLADKNLFYLLAGMVLLFITIAIPVQLDGNWVTLLWAGQALLLLWIGRKRQVALYEILSYPLMVLAFMSLLHDWSVGYNSFILEDPESRITPLFNSYFLTSLLFLAAFSGIYYIHTRQQYTSGYSWRELLLPLVNYFVPAVLLITAYFSFRHEIASYWDQLFAGSAIAGIEDEYGYSTIQYDYSLQNFKTIWIINYSILFFTLLSLVNAWRIKSRQLGIFSIGLNLLGAAVFLGLGLYSLSELRENYLNQLLAEYYHRGVFHLLIRYISLAFFAGLLFSCYKLIQQPFMKLNLREGFDYLLHFCLIWVASSELITWMDIAGFTQSYKLGLSILWGIYSLLLISLGIWKKKKHLRLGAIGLFALTLLKLFFYDISHLDTIAKTIVFVSLGILLLIISFLYNKYKNLIADEPKI